VPVAADYVPGQCAELTGRLSHVPYVQPHLVIRDRENHKRSKTMTPCCDAWLSDDGCPYHPDSPATLRGDAPWSGAQ
jgi:hypothetical protein